MNTNSLRAQDHFEQIYDEISTGIQSTRKQLEKLKVDHVEGRRHVAAVVQTLQEIEHGFTTEIELLHEHAEWDKFTVAFFGETNAGKSTVLESLRILFKEETRQKLLDDNAQDLTRYEQALQEHLDRIREGVQSASQRHAERLREVLTRMEAIEKIVRDEAASRQKQRLWQAALGGLVSGLLLAAAVTSWMLSH